MTLIEVQVDLVLRVFRFILIFTLLSCVSQARDSEVRRVILDTEGSVTTPQATDLPVNSSSITKGLLEEGSISATALDGSDLWIGKIGGGLVLYNIYTGEKKSILSDVYSLKDHSIKKILPYNNHVYILQGHKITEYNKMDNSIKVFSFPEDIFRGSSMVFYKDTIYISTLGFGLYSYIPETEEFSLVTKEKEFISALFIDGDNLYIGTSSNGLFEYNLLNNKFKKRLHYPKELFNKNITVINKKEGVTYLGTSKNGLLMWGDSDGSIDRLYPKESVSSIYLGDNCNIYSFYGYGIHIEGDSWTKFESIKSSLLTNNVTTVELFDNILITGNIKKGIINQELKYINDQKPYNK